VAERRIRKKRELIAEPLEVSVALRSCARSLRCSLLGLKDSHASQHSQRVLKGNDSRLARLTDSLRREALGEGGRSL
jgi:hypothetical protein